MIFRDREEAAERISEALDDLRDSHPLVLAVPRGAVPMAKIVAERLKGDLDIVLVHKFGHPAHPEYALGSVTEDGEIILGLGAERMGLGTKDVELAAREEIEKLRTKRRLFTPRRSSLDPRGRTAVIVDDGIATGATATAAVHSLRAKGAARIIIATPVASPEAVRRIEAEGAEVRSLSVPRDFYAVSQFYEDFDQVSDEEVIGALV